ncbi:preprotein translocase subunit YajC [Amnibacterium sp. CER49]|uniref:preprotein translocase subunit YajC n=1 Tax=Amnibacterium sp. CER49 TaxID=3039161 RepID=UPI00244C56EC|nr:preprotein translocase subunit YajC [Amnibacterium sp. CER49]MDH2444311.1 preprotein translocase subunit YajC [Amnibacterium sp. CER49]
MTMQPTTLLFYGAIILIVVLFMFRNGRKRQRDAAALTESLKPGAEIMTSSGIFGTVESVDDAENRIVLRTGPGSTLTIHRQAVGRVVTPVVDEAAPEPVLLDDAAAEPEFGQRVQGEPEQQDVPPAPARRASEQPRD